MRRQHRGWLCVSVLWAAVLPLFLAASSRAADDEYRIETTTDALPADELSGEVAGLIDATGYKIVKGESRTVCELWLCKSWPVQADFKATDAVAYPFSPGQLIGVLRFPRKGADFRDQEIAKGLYTLRYDRQPVDGNHVGTSLTRDFLLLVAADADKSAKPTDAKTLTEQSAAAAESKHPAMLALKKPQADADKPTLAHDELTDWWIATIVGKAEADGKTSALPIGIVVVGQANE